MELIKESLRLDAVQSGEARTGVGSEEAIKDPVGHLTHELRPMRAVARHVLAMTSADEELLVTLATYGSSNDRGAFEFSSNLSPAVLEALCKTIEPDDSSGLLKAVLTHEALTQEAFDGLDPEVLRLVHGFEVNASEYRGVQLDILLGLAREWSMDSSGTELLDAARELDAP